MGAPGIFLFFQRCFMWISIDCKLGFKSTLKAIAFINLCWTFQYSYELLCRFWESIQGPLKSSKFSYAKRAANVGPLNITQDVLPDIVSTRANRIEPHRVACNGPQTLANGEASKKYPMRVLMSLPGSPPPPQDMCLGKGLPDHHCLCPPIPSGMD